MAFDFKWLTRVNQTISPFKGQNPPEGQATGGPTMWMYNATSTAGNASAATLESANYFLGASGFFQVGDWIICDTNDPMYVILNVTAVTAGTTVTTAVYETSGGSGSFTTVSVGDGTAAAPSITFTSDTNTGFYHDSSHVIGVTANGAEVAKMGAAFTQLGNISAGVSGTAGTVTSFPATASNGSLILAAVNNAGNKTTTVSSVAGLGQNEVVTIPDAGAATANFILNAGVQSMAAGSSVTLDKGIGTESSNAVTINKQSGVITTTALTTAGGATETITLTNSLVATTSVVLATIGNAPAGNSATNAYTVTTSITAAHTVVFVISNLTTATALNGALVINFAVF